MQIWRRPGPAGQIEYRTGPDPAKGTGERF